MKLYKFINTHETHTELLVSRDEFFPICENVFVLALNSCTEIIIFSPVCYVCIYLTSSMGEILQSFH